MPPLTNGSLFNGVNSRPGERPVEPNYVCHGRLFFEQPNFERYGWDLGPVDSDRGIAGLTTTTWRCFPTRSGTDPFRCYDCSAGNCLPGDPTPFYLYPEEFSVTGLVGEASVVTGLFFLFP